MISLLVALLKDQMVGSPQVPVRELELPFLLESVKLVFGTLEKERGYMNKSAKGFDVTSGRKMNIRCWRRP